MDPGILCFHHCDHKVFCTIIPEKCPVCDQKLDRYDYNLLPFRVPYPFVKASQHPRAIVMKPTHGDFLNDYYNSKDLHIGVTNSQGCVIEFSEEGIRGVDLGTKKWNNIDSSSEWDQCLLLEQFDELWNEIWDSILLKVSVWKSTPEVPIKFPFNAENIPDSIHQMITEKRKLRAKWHDSRLIVDKKAFNRACKEIKELIKEHENITFNDHMESLSPLSKGHHSLWKATKQFRRPQQSNPPIKMDNDKWAQTDDQKAGTFATHLSRIFQPNNGDDSYEQEVDNILEQPGPSYSKSLCSVYDPNEKVVLHAQMSTSMINVLVPLVL
ncbi:Uncharacterized protein OBRU01_15835 [Operophtera brumata]|uniref:Uncharacterized protein n=1 Tax=Operophtera brumata TaxID=104452 RepID=A0A0L7L1E8_OPEBR|nr:Uncharacterized protein OBRU01_15835 [Operophtera brumata]